MGQAAGGFFSGEFPFVCPSKLAPFSCSAPIRSDSDTATIKSTFQHANSLRPEDCVGLAFAELSSGNPDICISRSFKDTPRRSAERNLLCLPIIVLSFER